MRILENHEVHNIAGSMSSMHYAATYFVASAALHCILKIGFNVGIKNTLEQFSNIQETYDADE